MPRARRVGRAGGAAAELGGGAGDGASRRRDGAAASTRSRTVEVDGRRFEVRVARRRSRRGASSRAAAASACARRRRRRRRRDAVVCPMQGTVLAVAGRRGRRGRGGPGDLHRRGDEDGERGARAPHGRVTRLSVAPGQAVANGQIDLRDRAAESARSSAGTRGTSTSRTPTSPRSRASTAAGRRRSSPQSPPSTTACRAACTPQLTGLKRETADPAGHQRVAIRIEERNISGRPTKFAVAIIDASRRSSSAIAVREAGEDARQEHAPRGHDEQRRARRRARARRARSRSQQDDTPGSSRSRRRGRPARG